MTPTDIGLLILAALAWVAVGVVSLVAKAFHHDELFTGVTPGVIPPAPDKAPRARLKGTEQEYAGEIAVAFSPPKGFRPGLVGTVIDGSVDSHDLTGTLVDLAVRGHLTIAAVPAEGPPSEARARFARRPDAAGAATDWVLTRTPEAPRVARDELDALEGALLDGVFHAGASVRMSQLDDTSLKAMRESEVALYRSVVERGWYPRHPQQQGGFGCLVIGAGVVLAGLFVAVRHTWPGVLAAVLVLGACIVLSRALRGRTPRTATGSAVRIQALGFKKYLQTAEADQFKFEEAAGIFSRYLPYAMVFGVAQHWAKVFGDVALKARAAGWSGADLTPDLTWFGTSGGGFDLGDLLFFDSLDGDFDLFGAGDALAGLGGAAVDGLGGIATNLGDAATGLGEASGLGDVASGLGDFASGVGDFMGSLDFLDGLGDGCGDLGGCIDF
jgi:Predicted membrane protein (DUF2207)